MPWSLSCDSSFIKLMYSNKEFNLEQIDPSNLEVTTEEMTIAGQKATKQTTRKINKEAPGRDLTIDVQFKNNKYFMFTLKKKHLEDEFSQILSTFEFIDGSDTSRELSTETIQYKARSEWQTYTDTVAGFLVQYDSNKKPPYDTYIKLADQDPGVSARFDSCNTPPSGPLAGQEVCPTSFRLNVYNNYSGGSRREWLISQISNLYKPFYMNYIIDGQNALVAIEGNPGGSSSMFVAIPSGNQMILYSSSASWNPSTGDLPDRSISVKYATLVWLTAVSCRD